jgi:deazaflavin-dependent oxidoreductase (nitroreductase family)
MEKTLERALENDRLIDITTTGRKSGEPHRIEIGFHNLEQEIFISGMPGRRDWYANLLAHPDFTFHLKQSTQADLAARAEPITDEDRRREILPQIVAGWNRQDQLEDFLARSPLVEVRFEDR